MRLNDIDKKAMGLGITATWKYSKKDLIKEIQKKEGFSPCYGTSTKKQCPQAACCWREDCLR